MISDTVFPGADWPHIDPSEGGFDAQKLAQAKVDLDAHSRDYRVVIVRHGAVVAEWHNGLGADNRQQLASAAKSIFSNMLGIAVAEGKIEVERIDYQASS